MLNDDVLLKDWIQYEELSSEDALPGDIGDGDGFNSSLYATHSSLADHLASIPNVIICPQASGDENEDVSYKYLNVTNTVAVWTLYTRVN